MNYVSQSAIKKQGFFPALKRITLLLLFLTILTMGMFFTSCEAVSFNVSCSGNNVNCSNSQP